MPSLSENLAKLLKRPDFRLWLAGEAFIAVYLCLLFGIGAARGWWALTGDTYEDGNNAERFLPEPPLPFGDRDRPLRQNGVWSTAYWYYWQTIPETRTWLNHLLPWLGYLVHQTLIWYFMYKAQRSYLNKPAKHHDEVKSYNWQIFATNVIMYMLHLAQTHWNYDGTAIDVIITSGLSSVSMMCAFVFLVEFKDRGILFGWPQVRSDDKIHLSAYIRPLTDNASYILRKYHGYCFSWFNIWTFWYHPMENTPAHGAGIWLIWQYLLQSSLIYTNFHLNKPWRLLVEVAVIFHGPMVALQVYWNQPTYSGAPNLFPMFFFGFLFCYLVTSIFNLDFWKKISPLFRPILWIIMMTFVFVYYEYWGTALQTWRDAIDACKIPGILYFTAVTGYVVVEITHRITAMFRTHVNPWIWLGCAASMVVLFTLLSILSYQLGWTQLVAFPKLANKMWTPMNGVLTGLFLVFLNNHFHGLRHRNRLNGKGAESKRSRASTEETDRSRESLEVAVPNGW